MRHSNYFEGAASIAGLSDDDASELDAQKPGDLDKARQAMATLRAAYAEAQKLIGEQDSLTATLKAKVTGVNLDALKGEVKMLGVAVDRFAGVLAGFDSSTPHSKVNSLIRDMSQAADIGILKESVNRNSLVKMAGDVGAMTVKDIEVKAKSLWESIPMGWKVVGGLGTVGLLYVAAKK